MPNLSPKHSYVRQQLDITVVTATKVSQKHRLLARTSSPRSVQNGKAEAQKASEFGIRVVLVRIGLVLGLGGGLLQQVLPPFQDRHRWYTRQW